MRNCVKKKINYGFTFVELMLVILILSILSGIAVPMFLRARIPTNEATIIVTLRTIAIDEEQYRQITGRYGSLNELVADDFFSDKNASDGAKSGYQVMVDAPERYWWYGEATPLDYGKSGRSTFYIDNSSIVRSKDNGVSGFVPDTVGVTWNAIKE